MLPCLCACGCAAADTLTPRRRFCPTATCRGTRNTQECNGHHGLWAAASSNVLITK